VDAPITPVAASVFKNVQGHFLVLLTKPHLLLRRPVAQIAIAAATGTEMMFVHLITDIRLREVKFSREFPG